VNLYIKRGFRVTTILGHNKFEPLRKWYPNLSTCTADEHVPEIERYIRTVKDRSCSAYCMLPSKHVPCIMLIHLMKNAVFWLNAVSHDNVASQKFSLIMIGQQVSFKKHAIIEFGAYVQSLQ
jgi:hypothetical protein